MFISGQTVPLHTNVEGRQGKSQVRLEMLPEPMYHLFEVTHAMQQGEHRLTTDGCSPSLQPNATRAADPVLVLVK